MAYRDLKPENVLVDKDGYAKITDFGLSKENIDEHNQAYSFCGTPEYLAPETLFKTGTGKQSDWWSFGCIVFEMLCGIPPFYTQNRHELYEHIKSREINFMEHEELLKRKASPEMRDLIQSLLVKNPAERLGGHGRDAEEIKEHPFFADHIKDWGDILDKKFKPPYTPSLDSAEDVRHFDECFTKMDPFGSYTAPRGQERKLSADMWSDFSCEPEEEEF